MAKVVGLIIDVHFAINMGMAHSTAGRLLTRRVTGIRGEITKIEDRTELDKIVRQTGSDHKAE